MNKLYKVISSRNLLMALCLTAGLSVSQGSGYGQEKPPMPILAQLTQVVTLQKLNFGTIIPTSTESGGSVTIPPSVMASRSTTGNVVTLGASYSPALFEVESNPGTLVVIGFEPNVTLSCSGGGTLSITNLTTFPSSPFITTSQFTQVYIGGTLIVQPLSGNPPGDCGGSVNIYFTQILQ